jgi:hypothetical protein
MKFAEGSCTLADELRATKIIGEYFTGVLSLYYLILFGLAIANLLLSCWFKERYTPLDFSNLKWYETCAGALLRLTV